MSYNDKQIQIINTAEKLFANRGYDGTSVRDIAEDAGINIAMISYYFGSKEKLMQAVFQQRTNYIAVRIESLLKDDSLSPIEKMGVLVDDYVDRVVKRQKFYKLMICEQMMEKNPMITNLLNELKVKNAELVEKLIKEGQEKGAFKENVDVMLLMNTMIGTIMQSFINKDYYKKYHKLDALSEEEYMELLKKKLSNYIKDLFKAILNHEG
jgi:AcrR family transcriptional regulator